MAPMDYKEFDELLEVSKNLPQGSESDLRRALELMPFTLDGLIGHSMLRALAFDNSLRKWVRMVVEPATDKLILGGTAYFGLKPELRKSDREVEGSLLNELNYKEFHQLLAVSEHLPEQEVQLRKALESEAMTLDELIGLVRTPLKEVVNQSGLRKLIYIVAEPVTDQFVIAGITYLGLKAELRKSAQEPSEPAAPSAASNTLGGGILKDAYATLEAQGRLGTLVKDVLSGKGGGSIERIRRRFGESTLSEVLNMPERDVRRRNMGEVTYGVLVSQIANYAGTEVTVPPKVKSAQLSKIPFAEYDTLKQAYAVINERGLMERRLEDELTIPANRGESKSSALSPLKEVGVETFGDFFRSSEFDFLSVPGMGAKRVARVKTAVNDYAVNLGNPQ